MTTNPPNDPKSASKDETQHARDRDPPRQDQTHESRPEHRADPSRKGHGPNNPLPGEPGGPSTSGYTPEARREAEEGQQRERDAKADKDHTDKPGGPPKR